MKNNFSKHYDGFTEMLKDISRRLSKQAKVPFRLTEIEPNADHYMN